jgi:hypothetical protein
MPNQKAWCSLAGRACPTVAATAAICVSRLAKPVAKFRFSKVNFNITQLGLWITEPLPKEYRAPTVDYARSEDTGYVGNWDLADIQLSPGNVHFWG